MLVCNDTPSMWTSSNCNDGSKYLVVQICNRVNGTPVYARMGVHKYLLKYFDGISDGDSVVSVEADSV